MTAWAPRRSNSDLFVPRLAGEPVELLDERVVELNQDLLACDDHMVLHMIRVAPASPAAPSGGG